MSAEKLDIVPKSQLAKPILGTNPKLVVNFGTDLHDIEDGMRFWRGVEFPVVVVGVTAMQKPPIPVPNGDSGMAGGVPGERHELDLVRETERLDSGKPKPFRGGVGVGDPLRPVSPVSGPVPKTGRFGHSGIKLGGEDVNLGVREVGQAATVVHVKVGNEDVAHVARRVAEPLYLPYGGFVDGKGGLGHLDPGGTEGVGRVADVTEPKPGLNEDQPVEIGLDKETVVDGPRGRRTVVGGLDLTHGPAVEVMDLHADYCAT